MANEAFNKIRKRLEDLLKTASNQQVNSAVQAYKAYGSALMKTPINGNQLMKSKDRLFGIIRRHHIGRMVMFFYDPKWANKLPYYDTFPLVIPIEMYNDGFLGLNLHYLPPIQRARLLDSLMNIYDNGHYNERKKLLMGYSILQRYVRSRLFVPCIKRYLYNHTKSRFFLIDPNDWEISILLPTERFMKANKSRVYQESMAKVKR